MNLHLRATKDLHNASGVTDSSPSSTWPEATPPIQEGASKIQMSLETILQEINICYKKILVPELRNLFS